MELYNVYNLRGVIWMLMQWWHNASQGRKIFFLLLAFVLLMVAVFGGIKYFGKTTVDKVAKKAGSAKVTVQQKKAGVAEAAEDWSLRYQKHEGNKILDEPLRDTPGNATEEEKSQIVEENKSHILDVARHDPWVLVYFLEGFGYKGEIPGFKKLEKIKLRKQYWYRLEGQVRSAKFIPTKLNGTFYNDGVVGGANPQQVSTPTSFNNVPATYVESNGNIFTIKNNCGNIQRGAPPHKAEVLPPCKEGVPPPPPPDVCHDPGSDRHKLGNPVYQPESENNPNHVAPTPGYTRGSAEQQAQSPQGQNTSGKGDSGTDSPPGGSNVDKPASTVIDEGPKPETDESKVNQAPVQEPGSSW